MWRSARSGQRPPRLVASVTRYLDPDKALAALAEGLELTESRPLGGTGALDGLRRLLL